jgi:hypothetical protein
MADTPRLDTVTPASALPGDQLTLAGAAFGKKTDASAIRFRLPEDHAVSAAGTFVDWAEATIHVQVPPLAAFGSGGPVELSVHTDAGDSDFLPLLLKEAAPPTCPVLDPAKGLESESIKLTGSGFGRPTADSKVFFQGPGSGEVEAKVTSWEPAAIQVVVPPLALLGGAGGQRTIVVSTPWGRSDPADFLLGELPQITAVLPASPSTDYASSPSPGATITVLGRAFGPQTSNSSVELHAVYDTGGAMSVTALTIDTWSDTKIEAMLPTFDKLRLTGLRDVVVTSDWGASQPDPRSRILIENRASITCWTRVEPHARTADLQQGLALGLQAQVYDALWLLGRQWQLLELQGQDAGSPVNVRVEAICSPLARWQPQGGTIEDVPAGVPLEVMVEREREIPSRVPGGGPFDDLRLSAEAGLQLLRTLDAQLNDPKRSALYRKWLLADYPIELPTDTASLDARSRRFLAVAANRVPNGSKIHIEFQVALGSPPQLPKKPPGVGHVEDAVFAAIGAWYAWCGELLSQATQDQRAWDPGRMEYSFSVGCGDIALDAREHDGGHLDWYSLVRRASGSSLGASALSPAPIKINCTALPNPVSYPGMPVSRWWELEDRRVDFGAVAAAPNELLKLVLLELATIYGNDWFTMPLGGLPIGSLCEITTVTVTDAFGSSIVLDPFSQRAGGQWRMFELTSDDGAASAGNALLLLDALPATLESSSVEEVVMLRDELANLAWAVEKIVEGRTGRPFDRHEDEATRRAQPAPPQASAVRRYLLQTTVPRNWIPLIPQVDHDAAGDVILRRLARGAMRDPAGGSAIPPFGRLLEPGNSLDIYDEELPRTGVRLTRLWTLGRASNGRTHLWRARRAGPGRGQASSGLRFDLTQPGRPDQR